MDQLKKVTLAVGDGGNDVPMIATAHVGVGIMGKEGMQASRASDFAIGEFRLLRRLVAVHGRYSLNRTTELIKYSFYKNICFAAPQIIFSFFNLFSGQSIHNSWISLSYNVFYTGLPPLVMGIFEKDLPEELLDVYPEAYAAADRKHPLTALSLVYNEVLGIVQGTLVFIFVVHFYDVVWDSSQKASRGMATGIDIQGMLIAPIIVSVVLANASLRLRHWTLITVWAMFISWILVYGVLVILNYLFCPDMNEPVMSCGIVIRPVLSHLRSWFFTGVMVIGATFPVLCANFIRTNYFPTEAQKLDAVFMAQGWSALRQAEHNTEPVGGFATAQPRPPAPLMPPSMPPASVQHGLRGSEQFGRPPPQVPGGRMSTLDIMPRGLSVSHQFSGPFSIQNTAPPPPFTQPPPFGPTLIGPPPALGPMAGDPHAMRWVHLPVPLHRHGMI